MGGKEVGRERDKGWRAGYAARVKGSFSLWLFFLLRGPRPRLQPQSCGPKQETRKSMGDCCESGCNQRQRTGGRGRDVPRTQTRQCEAKVSENEQIGVLFARDTKPLYSTNHIFKCFLIIQLHRASRSVLKLKQVQNDILNSYKAV